MITFNLVYTTQSNYLLGYAAFKSVLYAQKCKLSIYHENVIKVTYPESQCNFQMRWMDELVKLPFNLYGLINIFL